MKRSAFVRLLEPGQQEPDVADWVAWLGSAQGENDRFRRGRNTNNHAARLLLNRVSSAGEFDFSLAIIEAEVIAAGIMAFEIDKHSGFSVVPAAIEANHPTLRIDLERSAFAIALAGKLTHPWLGLLEQVDKDNLSRVVIHAGEVDAELAGRKCFGEPLTATDAQEGE